MSRFLSSLGLVALLLCTGAAAPEDLGLSQAQWREVEAGRVVVTMRDTAQATMKDILAVGYVEAGPESIWRVITDYERYPSIFPGILKSELRPRPGRPNLQYTLLDYPWPFEDRWTLNEFQEDPKHMGFSWRRIEGTVKEVVGEYRLHPEGRRTLLVYTVRFDPGLALVPAWLIDWGTSQKAPDTINQIRKFARAR